MALSVVRASAGVLKNHGVLACRGYNALSLRQCSIAHTLKVRDNIKKKRSEALVGGGQKRIEAQHKKVPEERFAILRIKTCQ